MTLVLLAACIVNPGAYEQRRGELECERDVEASLALDPALREAEFASLEARCPAEFPNDLGRWADCDGDGWGDPLQPYAGQTDLECGGLWVFNDRDCDDTVYENGGRLGSACPDELAEDYEVVRDAGLELVLLVVPEISTLAAEQACTSWQGELLDIGPATLPYGVLFDELLELRDAPTAWITGAQVDDPTFLPTCEDTVDIDAILLPLLGSPDAAELARASMRLNIAQRDGQTCALIQPPGTVGGAICQRMLRTPQDR